MNIMLPLPLIKRRESENSGDEPPYLVGDPRFVERAVTTVMEDDENPDENTSCEDHEGDGEPPGNGQAPTDQRPERHVGAYRIQQLPRGPSPVWNLMLCHARLPFRLRLAPVGIRASWGGHRRHSKSVKNGLSGRVVPKRCFIQAGHAFFDDFSDRINDEFGDQRITGGARQGIT